MFLIDFIVVIACGYFTRAGGDDTIGYGSNGDRGIVGLLLSCVVTGWQVDWVNIVFMVSYATAMAVGYGHPWGAVVGARAIRGEPEWWQRGVLKTNKHLALTARGLLGALILSPVCYVLGTAYPMLGIFLGFQVAPYLSLKVAEYKVIQDKLLPYWNMGKVNKSVWNIAETFLGMIVAIVVVLAY